MKISEGVEWGLHCAVLLAALPLGTGLSGSALAEYHGVSESYLLKHLKSMVKAGVLASVPGPKGGYRLAKSPEQISTLDIVDAIEGRQPTFRCAEIRQRGPACVESSAYRHTCFIHATMIRAETTWRRVLQEQSVADLAAQFNSTADRRIVSKTTVWLEKNVRNQGP